KAPQTNSTNPSRLAAWRWTAPMKASFPPPIIPILSFLFIYDELKNVICKPFKYNKKQGANRRLANKLSVWVKVFSEIFIAIIRCVIIEKQNYIYTLQKSFINNLPIPICSTHIVIKRFHMKQIVRFQLSFMMFLEFFIWGAWFVTLGRFLPVNLNATDAEIANVFSTRSWGAIIAPFIVGMIADRFFNAERMLALLHLVGAVLMYQMYRADEVSGFFIFVLVYMILYMPTLALVNSISFRQMKNPEKEFSYIRLFGTVGWIVAGLLISFLFKWDSSEAVEQGMLKNTFLMASIASLILGLFSFSLPKT